MNNMTLETVRLSEDKTALEILDQTLLPNEIRVLRLTKMEDIREAIYTLRVRGAPAIGVCAAYAMALAGTQINTDEYDAFLLEFRRIKAYIGSSRPTAVNLFWALDRMERVLTDTGERNVPTLREQLFSEAEAIREEDVDTCRAIGRIGFSLLHHGDGILTHCNAGRLATAGYGWLPESLAPPSKP